MNFIKSVYTLCAKCWSRCAFFWDFMQRIISEFADLVYAEMGNWKHAKCVLFNAVAGTVYRNHCALQLYHGRRTVGHNCALPRGSVMAVYRFALEAGDILSLNIQVFLVVTPCRLMNSYRCLEVPWCLHLQDKANLNWQLWNINKYIRDVSGK